MCSLIFFSSLFLLFFLFFVFVFLTIKTKVGMLKSKQHDNKRNKVIKMTEKIKQDNLALATI